MKQATARWLKKTHEFGDVYTFVAIHADSKLVPFWHVGRSTRNEMVVFINDLCQRLRNRPQFTTDAFNTYYP